MYYSNIEDPVNDIFMTEKFQQCLAFMKKEYTQPMNDVTELQLNNQITAHFQAYDTVAYKDIQFESHRKYYDIQFVLQGQEIIALSKPTELKVSTEYDEKNDIIFYDDADKINSQLILKTGDFAILGVADVHKPKLVITSPEAVRKIVIKVPIL